jgi:hypothetical protein
MWPNLSRMRLWVAAAVGLALCAAGTTACTAGVTGTGTYQGAAVTTTAPGTPAPTTVEATATTPVPTTPPPPPRYDPGRRKLGCAGAGILSPKGAPYCYRVPAGLRNVTGQVQIGGGSGSAKYQTAVGLAGRDVAVVMVYRTPRNSDLITDRQIVADMRPLLASLGRAGLVFSGSVPRTGKVDRARAFTYHARSRDSSYQADLTFVFRGRSQIEVLCQYATNAATMQRACGQLIGSLQIRTDP